MAQAKGFIGESYTDSAGKQWRWDASKKTYVRNYGTSPMASIERSWDQKIVPAAQQYAERQTRLTKEALNQKTPNINEYFNSLLQERWDSAVTEDEKASVKDLLAAFNLEEQKGIIQSERGAEPTSVIPESFAEGRLRPAGEEVEKEVTQSAGVKEDKKIQSGVIETEEDKTVEDQPPMMSIADLEKWERDTRDTTPAGKAFGEEGAEQRMAIRRRHLENRGTIFEDNVRQ